MTLPEFTPDRTWRPAKAAERVARELVDYIIGNDLPAGTRLPNEREMLEITGVGRTTLREALRLLESRGLISVRAGRTGGPVVRRPGPVDVAESVGVVLRFENASLRDVLDARCALEPIVARMATERITPAQLTALDENVARTAELRNDHRAFFVESQAFHSLLAVAASNVVMQVYVETIQALVDSTTSGVQYPVRRRTTIMDDHRRIVEALRARDADAAAAAMLAHLRESDAFWRKRYAHLVGGPIQNVPR